MDLRDNFKSRCPVRYNSDGTHWYCKRQLSEKQEIDNKTCNYSRCPGRELTEEEETARLLEIESKMKDTKKEVKKDPMDALIRRMKRELERIEAEEKEENVRKENVKKELKALEKKTASKKPIEPKVIEQKIEQIVVLPAPIIEEVAKPIEVSTPIKKAKAVKQVEQEITKPIEQEVKVEPVLKKCEWHICPNYFEFGKKEKFCCERCRRKDNRLKSRRRCALRKKEISAKGL